MTSAAASGGGRAGAGQARARPCARRALALVAVAALALCPAAAATADAPGAALDAGERELDSRLRALADRPLAQRLAAIDLLLADPRWAAPRWRAVLATERCAVAPGDSLPAALAGAAASGAPIDLRVAAIKCRQWAADQAGDPGGNYRAAREAWALLDRVSLPTLRFRVARDFADEAAYAGMLDEAMAATGRALDIARGIGDRVREADVLMTLSMVQSDLGRHREALANSDLALALDPAIARNDAKLVARSALQIHAGLYEEALKTLRGALAIADGEGHDDARLAIRVNMAEALRKTGRTAQALALTAELLPEAERLDMPYMKAYVWHERANTLAAAGQVDAGIAMQQRAREWFERGGDVNMVARTSHEWARQLAAAGRWQQAYAEIERAAELRETTQRAQREKSADVAAAMLESSRKDLDIERLRHQSETAWLQAQRWIAVAAALLLSAASLLFVHLRLRRANRELQRANAALAWESTHDSLTRVHNRRYFGRFLSERRARGEGRALLVLLDIDHFKSINDRQGHEAGDQVLQQLSQRLRESVRAEDRVVRWGGEEFLVFVDEPADAEAERALVLRLLDAVGGAPVQLRGGTLRVTASIGFASVTLADGFQIEAAISDVDALLYVAKRGGRARAIGRLQGGATEPVVVLPSGEPAAAAA